MRVRARLRGILLMMMIKVLGCSLAPPVAPSLYQGPQRKHIFDFYLCLCDFISFIPGFF